MTTITIGTADYQVYGNLVDAELYLAARIGSDIWDTKDNNVKNRALITATRLLDRQIWQGTKTVDSQLLDWPRIGVVDAEGIAVDDATVPQDIVDGSFEFALMLINNTELVNEDTTGSNIQRLKAGEVETWFFRPTLGKSRIPSVVLELVGQYLDSALNAEKGFISGGDELSSFDEPLELLRGFA